MWPNESPIGKKLLVGRFPGFAEVVGVVGDVKNNGLARRADARDVHAVSRSGRGRRCSSRCASAGGDPLALVSAVRAAVLAVDRDLPITRVETMDAALSDSVATERLHDRSADRRSPSSRW